VVIDHRNIFRAMGCPDKAGAELVIDAAAVLPLFDFRSRLPIGCLVEKQDQ
jgi:hypothetical protein